MYPFCCTQIQHHIGGLICWGSQLTPSVSSYSLCVCVCVVFLLETELTERVDLGLCKTRAKTDIR